VTDRFLCEAGKGNVLVLFGLEKSFWKRDYLFLFLRGFLPVAVGELTEMVFEGLCSPFSWSGSGRIR
jgi:hypothetical protein